MNGDKSTKVYLVSRHATVCLPPVAPVSHSSHAVGTATTAAAAVLASV